MNTAENSSPFAACTVISCTASCPACAWLSPASSDACDRKPASGVIVSGFCAGSAGDTGSSTSTAGSSVAVPSSGAAIAPARSGIERAGVSSP